MLANDLFAVVLDDSRDTQTQVQEIDALGPEPPREYLFERFRKELGHPWQLAHLDGVIELGRFAERHREDDEVGSPGHAVGVVRVIGNVLCGDNAGHRRAVRELAPVLIGRARDKPLDYGLVPERWICAVDARIQNADGDSFAGRHVGAELQLQIRVGLVGVDRLQAPLVLEARRLRIVGRDLLHHRLEVGFGNAIPVVSLDARILGRLFRHQIASAQNQDRTTEGDRETERESQESADPWAQELVAVGDEHHLAPSSSRGRSEPLARVGLWSFRHSLR